MFGVKCGRVDRRCNHERVGGPRMPAQRAAGRGRGLAARYWLVFAAVLALFLYSDRGARLRQFRTAAPGPPDAWTLKNYAGLLSEGVVSTAL